MAPWPLSARRRRERRRADCLRRQLQPGKDGACHRSNLGVLGQLGAFPGPGAAEEKPELTLLGDLDSAIRLGLELRPVFSNPASG